MGCSAFIYSAKGLQVFSANSLVGFHGQEDRYGMRSYMLNADFSSPETLNILEELPGAPLPPLRVPRAGGIADHEERRKRLKLETTTPLR